MLMKLQRVLYSKTVFVFILCVGLSLFAVFSYSLHSFFERAAYNEAKASFDRSYFLLREKLSTYIYGLQGISGIYITHDFFPSGERLREYAEFRNYFSNFPGLLGYGFIRVVDKKSVELYQTKMRKQIPDFKIKKIGGGYESNLYVIESIEPREGNRPALGLDIGSERNRREAAEKAIESGLPTMTASISLVQLEQENRGFLFLMPLYSRKYTPVEVKDRKNEIIGWAYAPIVYSAIEKFLESSISPNLSFQVVDMASGELIVNLRALHPGGFNFERELDFGGRKLLVTGVYSGLNDLHIFIPWLVMFSLGGSFIVTCYFVRRLVLARE